MILDNIRIYDPSQNFGKNEIFHLKLADGLISGIKKGNYSGSNGEALNGKQRVVAPSFTDSHLHLLRFGLMKQDLDLREAESWQQVKQRISDDQVKKELAEGDWLIARGLMDNTYQDIEGLAEASDLDEIENERPLFILHKDGHECVVNTLALEEIKKDDDLPLRHEQFIEKDADGNWTGRFKDTAVHFIKFHFRNKTGEEIESALRKAFPYLSECGITSVHPDDLNYAGSYGKVWKSYRKLEEEGALPLRAFLHHYVFDIDDMHYFLNNTDWRTGNGTDKVRVGAFKIFVDGTHRLHTAAMEEPYHDQPDARGTLIYEQKSLEEMVRLAEDNDMQVAMHCIGDRAVKSALKAIGKTENSMRHRIIHAQTLSDELLEEMQKVQPCVETQPGFLLDEWNRYAKWVGEKRGPYCGMGKSLEDADLPFTLSSDAPIGPINPWEHIFAAVNRISRNGKPQGGWIPSEKLDTQTAFKGYTRVPPYLEFKEHKKGMIKEGAYADFMILEDYPDAIEKSELKNIKVRQTWVAGEKVFEADD